MTKVFTEAEYKANAGAVIAHAASEGRAIVARPDGSPRVVISIPPAEAVPINDAIAARCTQIADAVVPEYRAGKRSYSCTGRVAKRWQAAWDGACIALGHEPQIYRIEPRRDM